MLDCQEFNFFPLSFVQQRFWDLHTRNPTYPGYNHGICLRFKGPIQPPVAFQCIRQSVMRHEILRTRFILRKGTPYQAVYKRLDVKIREEVLALDNPVESALDDTLSSYARRLCVLDDDLPYRMYWFTVSDEDCIFFMVSHPALLDNVSSRRLTNELIQGYMHEIGVMMAPAPAPEIQYGDYAVWQKKTFTPIRLESYQRYWRTQKRFLFSYSPRHFERQSADDKFENLSFSLFGRGLRETLELRQQMAISTTILLLAIFAGALVHSFNLSQFAIGVLVSNREQESIQKTLGNFANSILIPVQMESESTWRTLISLVRENYLKSLEFADVPLDTVVEGSDYENATNAPFYDIQFSYEYEAQVKYPKNVVQVKTPMVNFGHSRFAIALHMVERDARIDGSLVYNKGLLSSEQAVRLAEVVQKRGLDLGKTLDKTEGAEI